LTLSAIDGLMQRPNRRKGRRRENRDLQPDLVRRGPPAVFAGAQAQHLDAYVQSQEGWRLVRRFSDQASGATLERPGLQRALGESQAKRFDLLLVYRVDRLSRSVRGLAQVLEHSTRRGCCFAVRASRSIPRARRGG
jgi:Resolvase, N terminal domain